MSGGARLALGALLALAVSACTAPGGAGEAALGTAAQESGREGAAAQRAQNLGRLARSLTDEASCTEAGGAWGRGGLSPEPFCNMRYPDAGAACRDAEACGGRCLADEEADAGEAAVGRCQTFTSQFGCYGLVEDGVAGPTLCVD